MDFNLDSSWKQVLKDEFDKPYFLDLMDFVEKEYSENQCFPPYEEIFSAFQYTSFNDVKVVIIGQDPYHGQGQAHGLGFSVNESAPVPRSLKNIFTEINTDTGASIPDSGNLTRWAQQGVLLLNVVLTVRAHEAGSHRRKGWEKFTDAVIEKLSTEREGLVFMLWGEFAKKRKAKVDSLKHLILTSGHPSPLAAIRGHWFGNKHFSQANEFIKKIGEKPIVW